MFPNLYDKSECVSTAKYFLQSTLLPGALPVKPVWESWSNPMSSNFKWGKQGSEKLKDFPKVTKLCMGQVQAYPCRVNIPDLALAAIYQLHKQNFWGD